MPPSSVPGYRSPVTLTKFQMAPISSTLISSRSRKKEPRCACLSEAKAPHSHKMCVEVSSSVPHFLQVGLSLSPITCRCLLRVLCPVSRPITALVCVSLKDSSRAPVARSGPEINSRACLCALQGPPWLGYSLWWQNLCDDLQSLPLNVQKYTFS